MKKIFYVILSFTLMFVLTACTESNNDEFTYDDLFEANKIDNILSMYDNVSYNLNNSLNKDLSYSLFVSKDEFIEEKNDYAKITYLDNDYYYDKSVKELMKMYNVSDKTYRDIHGGWCIIYRKKGNETIIYQHENKDSISFTVELTGESAYKEIEYLTSSKLLQNESVMYDIVVDKKTLLVREFTEYIVNKASGKKTKVAKVSNIKYNVKNTKYISKIEELEKEIEESEESLLRTVTIVKDVNEENEKVYTFKVRKGKTNSLIISGNEEVDFDIYYVPYEDRECKKLYSFNKDVYNDMTIYLKKIK